MIHICDAIMGSGKTQSAITYMNEHPDQKFIYITPTLSETERIATACPALHFKLPSKKIEKYNYRKVLHTAALIAEGRNISTTHASFKLYTSEMIQAIRDHQYTLIIDEAVAMLSEVNASVGDVRLMIDAGYLERTKHDTYHYTGKEYGGGLLNSLYHTIQCNDIFLLEDQVTLEEDEEEETDISDAAEDEEHEISTECDDPISARSKVFYWELPPHALQAFKEVFILTYMFEGEGMLGYVQKSGVPYKYIGVHRDDDGTYRFSDTMDYYPHYLANLSSMVRIWDNYKMNSIGSKRCALSKTWFVKHATDDVDQLRKHLCSIFKYHFGDVPANQKMWTTFKDFKIKLRGNGYSNGFLPCNLKASNDYRDKTVLAYCVNLFMNPFVRRYLSVDGKMPSNEEYALSIMIQWIWRSAIRDGKPIDIYIPSKRMRTILQEWITDTQAAYHAHQKGGELCA